MVTTLNHDAFDEGEPVTDKDVYNIVYGAQGWTDSLDDATLGLLMKTGVVRLHATHSGVAFETRVYVSVKGKEPQ